mmetsp:Transcript_1030/g.2114  ORF Transcript_1030/g.2114 Transcript_1030/m.2114 type:complete len:87 (-) Transcript_1030:151-411(-)
MVRKLSDDNTMVTGSSGAQMTAWALASLLLAVSAWSLSRDECSETGILQWSGVPLSASSTEALQVLLMFGLALATSQVSKGTSFPF